tara:strand:+ start:251 stop:484 length:234 start_codon:yes stop_codon:yes gene_type:complete
MIVVNKIYPYLCKLASCMDRADYEFTDAKTVKTEQEDGLVKEEIKTIILGHACFNHVEEVNKMLKEIHNGNKKSDNI